jgi:3-deoxy-7-phosphoheptulonate synthase
LVIEREAKGMLLVVMGAGSSRVAAEAVREKLGEAGLDAIVFEGAGHVLVGAEGEVPPETEASLRAMAGVRGMIGAGENGAPETRDLRITDTRPMLPPEILLEQLPLSGEGATTVNRGRGEVADVLSGRDDRLVVVVGPCSVHDPAAALEYAGRLKELEAELAEDLLVVMRVYFEKPRTTVGWKGLINDPHLDDSFAINDGLHMARKVLLDIIALGLPAGCEFLDPIIPQFFADAVTWGAIGARTTESQVHRELASGLSMPVGFKNGTGGGIRIAVDAVRAAAYPHSFLGVARQGLAAILTTSGNLDCHVILRGGRTGPNYDPQNVRKTLDSLREAGLPPRVMIDASHDNSGKDHRRQPLVAGEIAAQVARGEPGIVGVMLESFLVGGNQKLNGRKVLVYGQSVTDACMGWETTVPVLRELAEAVRRRRSVSKKG